MKITNQYIYPNNNAQKFGALKRINCQNDDMYVRRMAIALEDSLGFKEFCSKYDVLADVFMAESKDKFHKPAVSLSCKKSGVKDMFSLPKKLDIIFEGDIESAPQKPNFLTLQVDNFSERDYQETMCSAISKVINMKSEDFENALMEQHKNGAPIPIKLTH